jgi:hypothetical protein
VLEFDENADQGLKMTPNFSIRNCHSPSSHFSKCLAPTEQLRSASEKFSFLIHQPASSFVACVPIVDANFCAVTDADSGTFSSEEDEVMNGTVDTLNGIESQVSTNYLQLMHLF